MTRQDAWDLLTTWTTSDALLRHARSVETVMRALARRFGEDEETWGVAGLLHDADYEAFPERHPQVTVEALTAKGETALARAVSAHYTKWGVPYETRMEKALVAADELTGFVTACSLVNPAGLAGLTPASVVKKFRKKDFAAKVERDEITAGAALLDVPLEDLVQWVIDALAAERDALGLR